MIIEINQKQDGKDESGRYKLSYKLTTDVRNDNFWTTDDTDRDVKEVDVDTFDADPTQNWQIGVFSYSQVLYGMEFSTETKHYFQRES